MNWTYNIQIQSDHRMKRMSNIDLILHFALYSLGFKDSLNVVSNIWKMLGFLILDVFFPEVEVGFAIAFVLLISAGYEVLLFFSIVIGGILL